MTGAKLPDSPDADAGADAGTLTGRFVDAAIRRLLRFQPSVPGRPPVLLVAMGLGLAALALCQLAVDPEPLGPTLVELLVPGTGAAVVLALGRWTATVERSEQKHASGAIVGTVFMAIALSTVLIILVTQLPTAVGGFDYPFAVVTALSVGAVVGVPTGFVLDEVIARKEALEAGYRETRRLNQQLQVLNRVMRHNVRNELTVAQGGLDIVGAEVSSPRGRDWHRRAERALQRLLDHTEKLLDLGSLERSDDQRADVDLVDYVEAALERVVPGDVAVETDLPDSAVARAHPLVGTAVVEAIENAVAHNDHRDLAVAVRIAETDGEIEVAVADTGGGLPAAELESLRAGDEHPLRHGQGVGLWFIRWVVDASDGAVSFGANDPSGTVVRMRLPAAG